MGWSAVANGWRVRRQSLIGPEHLLKGVKSYAAMVDRRYGPLPPLYGLCITRGFWLVTHVDMRRLARIDAVAQWLEECVSRLYRASDR